MSVTLKIEGMGYEIEQNELDAVDAIDEAENHAGEVLSWTETKVDESWESETENFKYTIEVE